MDQDQLDKYFEKIALHFKGNRGIVGERVLEIGKHEESIKENLVHAFGGFAHLLDPFLDFYLESLQLCASRSQQDWSWKSIVIISMHVSSFWRFRASYIIFWSGYYADALSLIRGLYENAILLAAIGGEAINVSDMHSRLTDTEIQELSIEEALKKIRTHHIKLDKKLSEVMVGKESRLTEKSQKEIKRFVNIMHDSIHKSRMNFTWLVEPLIKGDHHLPFLPEYSEKSASLYVNFSLFTGWMMLRCIGLLQVKHNEFGEAWMAKYEVLDESFKISVADFEKPMGRAIEELVNTKFVFNL